LIVGVVVLTFGGAQVWRSAPGWRAWYAKWQAEQEREAQERQENHNTRLYNHAMKLLYEAEDFQAAADAFTVRLQMGRDVHSALNRMECYLHMNDFERFIDLATEVMNEYEGEVTECYLYEDRGYAHYCLGNYEQALADLTLAIDSEVEGANLSLAYSCRGWIYAACADSQYHDSVLAESDASSLIDRVNASDWLAYDQAGTMYARSGNFYAAMNCVDHAIKQLVADKMPEPHKQPLLKEFRQRRLLYQQDRCYQESEPRHTHSRRLNVVLF